MTELKRIYDLLKNVFESRPAWHGSSVLQLLEDVTSTQALRRPIPNAHTIWELVLHITVWEDEARKCLEGETFPRLPNEKDWPPARDTSEEAWHKTVEELKKVHQHLLKTLAEFDPERLNSRIPIDGSYPSPWSTTTFYVMLHGIGHHAIYHAGQIAILKK